MCLPSTPPIEKLDVNLLTNILNPYRMLNVTRSLVENCLENKILITHYHISIDRVTWTPKDHAARIAYLATKGWNDPIELDFGIPSLGHSWYPLLDGHHRLAAAIFKKDQWISGNCAGDVKEIEKYRWHS